MPGYAYAILGAGWVLWVTRFLVVKRSAAPPKQVDRRARWGILLVAVAYSLLWQSKFWARPVPAWRMVLAAAFLLLAALLSWTAVRALGRQWRFDAGLSADHQLVTWGPYRVVRHPIYTSMLLMLLGTGFMVTPLRLLAAATLVFVVGTEIRVRIEDRLLAQHFGAQFEEYRSSVPAYIPLIR
ncbi:MAG TPA: isoprenylcysteine carboxylmethyltransferase family protein [Terriglobia bacterium]|nr:isoprenylcysteine carboxylmethyltransferase family protein [Terriglobia bacterium]